MTARTFSEFVALVGIVAGFLVAAFVVGWSIV